MSQYVEVNGQMIWQTSAAERLAARQAGTKLAPPLIPTVVESLVRAEPVEPVKSVETAPSRQSRKESRTKVTLIQQCGSCGYFAIDEENPWVTKRGRDVSTLRHMADDNKTCKGCHRIMHDFIQESEAYFKAWALEWGICVEANYYVDYGKRPLIDKRGRRAHLWELSFSGDLLIESHKPIRRKEIEKCLSAYIDGENRYRIKELDEHKIAWLYADQLSEWYVKALDSHMRSHRQNALRVGYRGGPVVLRGSRRVMYDDAFDCGRFSRKFVRRAARLLRLTTSKCPKDCSEIELRPIKRIVERAGKSWGRHSDAAAAAYLTRRHIDEWYYEHRLPNSASNMARRSHYYDTEDDSEIEKFLGWRWEDGFPVEVRPTTYVTQIYCWVCGELLGFCPIGGDMQQSVHSNPKHERGRPRCNETKIYQFALRGKGKGSRKREEAVTRIIRNAAHSPDVYHFVRLHLEIEENKREISEIERKQREQILERGKTPVDPTATPDNVAGIVADERTAQGLRNALFDEMDDLRAGKSNPSRARSMSLLANCVLQSVSTEVEVYRYIADARKIGKEAEIIGVLQLGEDKKT